MDTLSRIRTLAGPSRVLTLPGVGRVAGLVLSLILLWQERARQRDHLESLDDAMLKDIGLSRADVDREAAKPFWRP
jgi:uncharacterized protein YjiS (DUF1127 family)